jgi:tetratricopeptide (TPR) repeat protein
LKGLNPGPASAADACRFGKPLVDDFPAEAEEVAGRALDRWPGSAWDASLYEIRGKARFRQGHSARAADDLKAADAATPPGRRSADLAWLRAAALARSKQPAAAVAAMDEALARAPGSPRRDEMLMDRAEAVLASHQGRHDAATAAAYRRVADETPSSPRAARALYFAAFGYEAVEDLARARACIDGALAKAEPKDTALDEALQFHRARLSHGLVPHREAAALFDVLARRHPAGTHAVEGRYRAGLELEAAEEFDQAAERFGQVIAAGPGLFYYYARLGAGRCALARRRPAEAEAHFREVAEKAAGADVVAEAWLNLGRVAQSRLEYSKAHKAYDRAIASSPGPDSRIAAFALLFKADIQLERDKRNEAAVLYEAVVTGYRDAVIVSIADAQAKKLRKAPP